MGGSDWRRCDGVDRSSSRDHRRVTVRSRRQGLSTGATETRTIMATNVCTVSSLTWKEMSIHPCSNQTDPRPNQAPASNSSFHHSDDVLNPLASGRTRLGYIQAATLSVLRQVQGTTSSSVTVHPPHPRPRRPHRLFEQVYPRPCPYWPFSAFRGEGTAKMSFFERSFDVQTCQGERASHLEGEEADNVGRAAAGFQIKMRRQVQEISEPSCWTEPGSTRGAGRTRGRGSK